MYLEHVKSRLRNSHRFIFDNVAVEKMGNFIIKNTDLLYEQQIFARPPFDNIFIEFNANIVQSITDQYNYSAENDYMFGILIDNGDTYLFIDADEYETGGPILMPIAFELHTLWTEDEQLAFCKKMNIDFIDLDVLMWGNVIEKLNDYSKVESFRKNNKIKLLPFASKYKEKENISTQMFLSRIFGEFRNIIAALLMLNRPSITRYVSEVPRRKGFYKGKLRTFLSHTVVTIDVDPAPILRIIGTEEGNSIEKRWHEVRGVYCHDEAYRIGSKNGCQHKFVQDPKYTDERDFHMNYFGKPEADNWVCTECGGHRWWRNKHGRGNKDLGSITTEYRVKG